MIVDERLVTYINSLDTGNTSILDQIEQEALENYVPIIRKEMQQFLKLLLAMKRPMRILEVGTAVGFSAILMAEYDPVSKCCRHFEAPTEPTGETRGSPPFFDCWRSRMSGSRMTCGGWTMTTCTANCKVTGSSKCRR